MDVTYALLCEHVSPMPDSRFKTSHSVSFVGVSREIRLRDIPGGISRFFVVAEIAGHSTETSTFRVNMIIVDSDGEKLLDLDSKTVSPPDSTATGRWHMRFAFPVEQHTFEDYGRYRAMILVNSEVRCKTAFYVVEGEMR